MVGLLLAMSSLVFIEPAPYDVLLIMLFVLAFTSGLPIPRELQVPGTILVAFLLCNILAAALSGDPTETFRSLGIRVYMVGGWLFFVSIIVVRPRRILPLLWGGYVVAAVFATAFGTAEYFGIIPSEDWAGGLRAKGPFKDPNVFGPFLVPVALHCAARIRTGRPSGRFIYFLLFLLFSFGVLISFSRGAWINYVLSTLIFIVMSLRASRSLRQKLNLLLLGNALVLAAFTMAALAISFTSVADRFFQRAVIAQKYDVREEGGRFAAQRAALSVIGETPLGIGPGRAAVVLGMHPHNVYIFMFLESGWLGGLTWVVFVLYTTWIGVRLLRWRSDLVDHSIVIGCSLMGALAQSLFIDSGHWRHLWLLFAMAWALSIIAGREDKKIEHPGSAG